MDPNDGFIDAIPACASEVQENVIRQLWPPTMVFLSNKSEASDSLDVISATRREIKLVLQTEQLLRKARGRSRTRLLPKKQAAISQITDQMSRLKRAPFRGKVSADIDIRSADVRFKGIRAVAKEYVDLLKIHVVPDDVSIDHLAFTIVSEDREDVIARITLTPSRLFSRDYDRAFRNYSDLANEPELAQFRTKSMDPFGRYDLKQLKFEESLVARLREIEAIEQEQLSEYPGEDPDLDLSGLDPEFGSPEVRDSVLSELEQSCRAMRGRWFCDQWFDATARPGSGPEGLEEIRALGTADIGVNPSGVPGWFQVSPDRTSVRSIKNWDSSLRSSFLAGKSSDERWSQMKLPIPLTLDIGLAGPAASQNDVDNAAYRVIDRFSEVFDGASPKIQGFRVYRTTADAPTISVKPIAIDRLFMLRAAMKASRQLADRDRCVRERWSPTESWTPTTAPEGNS